MFIYKHIPIGTHLSTYGMNSCLLINLLKYKNMETGGRTEAYFSMDPLYLTLFGLLWKQNRRAVKRCAGKGPSTGPPAT